MAFYGIDFIFDDQFSQNYGLKIVSINDNSIDETSSGSNIQIFSDSVYRNPTRFQYGVSQSEVLSFEMSVFSETPISAINRSKIQKWLFGRMTPCKLQIVQFDLQTVYFNCYLINSKIHYINNQSYGFSFTVECDAPWAWQMPKSYSKKAFDDVWKFYNDSDNTDYTFPLLEFKMRSSIIGDGNIGIENISDNNRSMQINNLNPNEVINIDCNRQIIKSSEKRLMSDSFNKIFFRLLSGINNLKVSGEIECCKMTFSNARRVGG